VNGQVWLLWAHLPNDQSTLARFADGWVKNPAEGFKARYFRALQTTTAPTPSRKRARFRRLSPHWRYLPGQIGFPGSKKLALALLYSW